LAVESNPVFMLFEQDGLESFIEQEKGATQQVGRGQVNTPLVGKSSSIIWLLHNAWGITPENELLKRILKVQTVDEIIMSDFAGKIKSKLNIQNMQLGEITNRCRDRSTQLIRGKIAEQKDKKKE